MGRAVSMLAAALMLGCAQAPQAGPRAACLAQGHATGSEEFRVCLDAGGAAVATGPGSPYANADEEEGGF